MRVIGARKSTETVYLADPAEHPGAPSWEVDMSDAGVDRIRAIVGDAVERVRYLTDEKSALEAQGDAEGMRRAAEDAARLERRVISAFIGREGYDEALRWIAGEGADPLQHISAMGDVMAALLLMLADHAGNERLAEVGRVYGRKAAKAGRKKGKGKRAKGLEAV